MRPRSGVREAQATRVNAPDVAYHFLRRKGREMMDAGDEDFGEVLALDLGFDWGTPAKCYLLAPDVWIDFRDKIVILIKMKKEN